MKLLNFLPAKYGLPPNCFIFMSANNSDSKVYIYMLVEIRDVFSMLLNMRGMHYPVTTII